MQSITTPWPAVRALGELSAAGAALGRALEGAFLAVAAWLGTLWVGLPGARRRYLGPLHRRSRALCGAQIALHRTAPARDPREARLRARQPREFHWIEITVRPRQGRGRVATWRPRDLSLVAPSARPGRPEEDEPVGVVHAVAGWQGNAWVDLGALRECVGPRRLRLLVALTPGARNFRFRYYLELLRREPGGEPAAHRRVLARALRPSHLPVCAPSESALRQSEEAHAMALEILQDPRLQEVEWKDLCDLSRFDVAYEVSIYLPWLAASLVFAHFAGAGSTLWMLPALGCSFMFFLCGLRQVHNAFHYAVGVSRPAHEWLMFVLSPLMMSAMHAVQWNHLRHHRHCMDDEDIEAMSAKMPGWKALITGPQFPVRLHKAALQKGNARIRGWIHWELASMVAMAVLAFGVVDWFFLQYHVVAMVVGQCFSAFFAVWTVHHDCDREHYIARTIRNPMKAFVTYDMFYHVEHHLFPTVPTCKLPKLAERLDEVAPELKTKLVF